MPGYKNTNAGLIPEAWVSVPLGKLGHWFSGGTPSKAVAEYWSGEIPWVSPKDMKTSRLHGAIDSVSQTAIGNGTRLLPAKAILVVVRGMILAHSAPVARAEVPLTFNQDIKALIVKEGVDSDYVLWWLVANKELLLSKTSESTHGTKRLPSEALFQLELPLPTKAEQEAIAEALSDADALIESIEELVKKKRLIKQGAMQELLTGKKRLPGFESKPGTKQTEVGEIPVDWDARALGPLVTLMTNGFVGTATKHYTDHGQGVLYIQGYNVEEGSFNFHGIKFVTESFHREHLKSCLKSGDLLTVQTGDVGLTTVVPPELAGSNCHALIISRLKPAVALPMFVSAYLNSNQGRDRLRLIEIGTTMKHLNVGDMLEFKVPLPSTTAEQEAIGDVLTAMDDELKALDAKLTKTRQIKQGMMHELLTGRIRLV